MDKTDERLARIEDRLMALTAVVQGTFQTTFRAGPERKAVRDLLCSTLESIYGDPRLPLSEEGHFRLQRALGYLEEIAGG